MLRAITSVTRFLNNASESWRKTVLVIAIIMSGSLAAISYKIVSFNYSQSADYYASLSERLRVDERINPILMAYLNEVGADRVMVAELHDGKRNTSNIRFAYMSGTYEADDRGIAHILRDFQNIPTSMFSGYWVDLLADKCISIHSTDGSSAATLFSEYGVSNTYVCPIFLPHEKNNLVGVLITSWRVSGNKVIDEITLDHMDSTGLILSGLISGGKD